MTAILRGVRMPAALLSLALMLVTFGGMTVSAGERAVAGEGNVATLRAGAGSATVYIVRGRRNDWRRHRRYWRRERRELRRERRYWRR